MDDYTIWVATGILEYMKIIGSMVLSTIPQWLWGLVAIAALAKIYEWKTMSR